MGAGAGEVCHETMGDDGVGPVHVQQKGISLCPGGSVTELVPGGGVSGDGDAEKPDEGVDSLQTPVRGNE